MRRQHGLHDLLFTFGVICLCLATGLFAFVLYVLPHVLFNLNYEVPEFVVRLTYYYQAHHGLDGLMHVFMVVFPVILAGLAFLFIANYVTHIIEHDEGVDVEWEEHEHSAEEEGLTNLEGERVPLRKPMSNNLKILLPMLGLVIGIFALLFFLEFMIATDIPT
jgi:hypothetical protein